MQDWLTDDPMHFLQSMKTGVQVRERKIVRYAALVFLAAVFGVVTACTAARPNGYIEASAWSANYTEDYILDYSIQTASGKDTGAGGAKVAKFSQGGTGGSECCALVPGVGQTVKVVWSAGRRDEEAAQGKTYSRDVVVRGYMPTRKDAFNILMTRFFPNHQVEVELIPDRGEVGGSASPRVDKLYYGERVMRQMGE